MKKSLYILTGLGADERVFQFLDFSGYSVTFIKWTTPQENETIEEYAKNLLSQIPEKQPILIGLSFGGMMSIEIAKHIKTEKIIIISSAKSKYEIPFYYRWMGYLMLHKIVPLHKLKKTNPILNWLFGTHTEVEKRLLNNFLNDMDPTFLKWSIKNIIFWKNTKVPKNLYHIHGTSDRILPIIFGDCDIKVKGGDHFMIMSKAEEVTKEIRKLL